MGRKRVRWFGVHFSLGMPSKTGFCPVQPILYRPLLFSVWEYKVMPFHRDPHWAIFAQRFSMYCETEVRLFGSSDRLCSRFFICFRRYQAFPFPLSLTSKPLTLCRKSVGMSDATRTAGAKQLPSQACFIVPIATARCMSTAPTTASAFLNTPAHSTQKFLAGHSARPSTVSMKRWYRRRKLIIHKLS